MKFTVTQRKLVYLKWQEILVSLLKTYKHVSSLPKLSSSTITSLKGMFFPSEFDSTIVALKELSSIILEIPEIRQDKREDSYPVAGLLALCGWRVIDHTPISYCLECPSCLRRVESSIIEQ